MRIRSKLANYRARAKNPKTGEWDVWEILLNPANPDDLRSWRIMATSGGYTNISLTRVKSSITTKSDNKPKPDSADIAREGLKLLDAILAARKGQKA